MKPQYKIHGSARRVLKQKLSILNSYIRNFWWCHNLEIDMSKIYGGDVMSDEVARIKYDEAVNEATSLDKLLTEPYE